jgi:hypothetical protein
MRIKTIVTSFVLAGGLWAVGGATFSAQAACNNGLPADVYTGTQLTGAGTGAGACVDNDLGLGFDGGKVEAGASGTAVYVVADGDNANSGLAGGYVGISNYESGTDAPATNCPQPSGPAEGGSGSNSGGCYAIKDGSGTGQSNIVELYVPTGNAVPLPVCGSTSGKDFGNTNRDGCRVDTP